MGGVESRLIGRDSQTRFAGALGDHVGTPSFGGVVGGIGRTCGPVFTSVMEHVCASDNAECA